MATQKKDTPDNFLLLVYRFLSSYKLATVVLILMTLVTLFGTLGQVNHGLHAAKEKYFYSFLLTFFLMSFQETSTVFFVLVGVYFNKSAYLFKRATIYF